MKLQHETMYTLLNDTFWICKTLNQEKIRLQLVNRSHQTSGNGITYLTEA